MRAPAVAPLAVGTLARGQRWALVGSVAVVAGVGWATLASAPEHGGGGVGAMSPHADAGGWRAYPATVAMWLAMSVAMMLPAVLPWLLTVAALVEPDATRGRWRRTAAFASGYLVVWAGYSLAAAALQVALSGVLRMTLAPGGGALAGGVLLVAAGAFQWTELKESCLSHCRSPLSWFLTTWKDQRPGPVRMGLQHGVYCLGCCWALMLLCLAMGSMNLLWMALLTLVVIAEKLLPGGRRLGRAVGVALAGWGLLLLAGLAAGH